MDSRVYQKQESGPFLEVLSYTLGSPCKQLSSDSEENFLGSLLPDLYGRKLPGIQGCVNQPLGISVILILVFLLLQNISGLKWIAPSQSQSQNLSGNFLRLLLLQAPEDPGPTAPPLAPAGRSALA